MATWQDQLDQADALDQQLLIRDLTMDEWKFLRAVGVGRRIIEAAGTMNDILSMDDTPRALLPFITNSPDMQTFLNQATS